MQILKISKRANTSCIVYLVATSMYVAIAHNFVGSETLVPELELVKFDHNIGLLLALHVFLNICFILNFGIFNCVVYEYALMFWNSYKVKFLYPL